jgi:hypothetical protein
VVFTIAPIVAPAGDRSIAITRDCFEPGLVLAGLGLPTIRLDGLAGGVEALDFAGDRFFADFLIEIPRSIDNGSAPHHRSPTSAMNPAGQDLRALPGAQVTHSTARFAADCQSFLGLKFKRFCRAYSEEIGGYANAKAVGRGSRENSDSSRERYFFADQPNSGS